MTAETGVVAEKAQRHTTKPAHMGKKVQELCDRQGVPFQDWEALGEADSKVPDDPEMGKLHGSGRCLSSTRTTWTFTSILPKIDAEIAKKIVAFAEDMLDHLPQFFMAMRPR